MFLALDEDRLSIQSLLDYQLSSPRWQRNFLQEPPRSVSDGGPFATANSDMYYSVSPKSEATRKVFFNEKGSFANRFVLLHFCSFHMVIGQR